MPLWSSAAVSREWGRLPEGKFVCCYKQRAPETMVEGVEVGVGVGRVRYCFASSSGTVETARRMGLAGKTED